MIIYNIEEYGTARLADMLRIATLNMVLTERAIPNAREEYKEVFDFNEKYIADIKAELAKRTA